MKLNVKGVLRAAAMCASILWFAGCEAEAEESAGAATNAPTAAATNNAVTNVVATNEQTVILAKVEPTIPPGLKLSKAVEEVVKLAQAGVSETVMLLFVEKSTEPFDLDAAEIVYLNDIGIPQTVIASMLNQDGASQDLQNILQTNITGVATAPTVPTTPAPQSSAAVQTPQPAPGAIEVSSNYVADPNYQQPVVQQQPIVVQQPVIVQQPVVVEPAVTHSYFYSSLAPYGSWVELPDYGWCWQPTIASVRRGWRPYAHGGRWLYSDHGWYWHSDYSWGWAPFHYGRWYSAPRHGWVWVPDYTWGPSWVTWRYSGGYSGWAPLPPRAHLRPGVGFSYWGRDVGFSFSFGLSHDYYTFVPTRRFCDRRIIDHVVPTEKTVNIYKDSTVVNNYIVGNNNTIINNGIARDRIVSHTRQEVPRVRVQEAAITPTATVKPDRLHRNGSELVVYRPKAPPSPVTASTADRPTVRQESRRFPGTVANAAPRAAAVSPSSSAAPTSSRQEGTRRETASVPARERSEAFRPAIASRTQPLPFGKPEPVRPEPEPVFTPSVRSSRAVQEARTRPTFPTTVSRSEQLARQGSTGSSRFGASSAAAPLQPQSGRFGNPVTPSTRPATPSVPSTVAPNSNSRFGARAVTPPASRATVPGSSRFGGSAEGVTFGTAPAKPPSISGQAVPGAPQAQPRNETRYARPNLSRQSSTAAPAPQVAPQQPSVSVNRTPLSSSRFGSSAPAASPPPTVIGRTETFRRPSVPQVQSTPAPLMQPRSINPVPPPSYSAPPAVRSTPAMPRSPVPSVSSGGSRFGGSVSVNPGTSSGGSRFGSPPPARAPAPSVIQRSSPPAQTPQRGRVEIGR